MTEKEMQVKQKQEVQKSGEPTKPDKYFVPAVDIYETREAVTLLAEMPGVSKDGVEIGLEEDTLTIKGTRGDYAIPGDKVLLQEFESGHYYRNFNLAETIDREAISAKMTAGILTLVLPKMAPAKPRRIEVKG